MSLLYWLPFNGNTTNQGCKSITYSQQTNASTFENGKIGQCLKLSSTDLRLPINYDSSQGFTLAFWFKKDSTAGAWSDFITLGSTVKDRLEINTAGTGGNIQWYNSGSGVYTSGTNLGAITADTWYHFALVVGATESRIYINGVANSKVSTPSHYTIDTCVIGNRIGSQYMVGGMNDFRFYDSALSAAEVQELARGLMLHYPMCNVDGKVIGYNYFNEQNVNLLSNMTQSGYTFTQTTADTRTLMQFKVQLWTGSTLAKSVTSKTFTSLGDNFVTFSLDDSVTYDAIRFGLNGSAVDTCVRFSVDSMLPSGTYTLAINLLDDTQGSVAWKDVRLTKSDTILPWLPHSIGDDATIADTSGYGNRGNLTDVTALSDCALGQGSYVLNGGYIVSNKTIPLGEKTYSIWVNFNALTAGFIVDNRASNVGYQPMYYDPTSGIQIYSSSSSGNGSYIPYTFTTGQWYHLVVTMKDISGSLYVNGTLVKTITVGADLTDSAKVYVGTRHSIATPVNAQVNDLRVYATALDEAAVKQLYEARFRFYPDGSIGATEYVEGQSTQQFMKTGVFNNTQLIETFVDVDGAKFVKILHHNNHSATSGYLFSSSDAFSNSMVYKNEDCWSALGLLNSVDHGDGYEIVIHQYANETDTTPQKFRFVQTVNPLTAAYADVDNADITPTTVEGYDTISSSYGGLYLKKSSTYLCANNSNSGNWWGAVGAWTNHNGGIPGYNGQVVKGLMEVFVRVYDDTLKSFPTGYVYANNFKED